MEDPAAVDGYYPQEGEGLEYVQQQEYVPQQHPTCEEITPDYVLGLNAPTDQFLCPLSANIYHLDFTAFRIRNLDCDPAQVLFEVAKEPEDQGWDEDEADDNSRMIRYHFGPHFLDIMTVGTELTFTIGDLPMNRFRMIERHYYFDQIIKSFDFEMPFAMPNSTNSWEVMYTMPELNWDVRNAMMTNPWCCASDTFYFVDGRLIMHNKAQYNYANQ
jgi:hypothetical protein